LSNSGFVWVRPPEALAKNFEAYGQRIEAALYAAANAWGQSIQDAGRAEAEWVDRTANARSGLFYAVEGFGMGQMVGDISAGAKALMRETSIESAGPNEIIITLGHTVYYGKYLELSHGGRYAIIMSTIEKHLPALEALIRKSYGSA
jgi:hypothetical protein